jgi:hypothetical protein
MPSHQEIVQEIPENYWGISLHFSCGKGNNFSDLLIPYEQLKLIWLARPPTSLVSSVSHFPKAR